jgi:excisionase family DNA binding protein
MTTGFNAEQSTKAFFNPDELGQFLGISKATVYRLISNRQIPFYKVGGGLRFRRGDIEEYLQTVRIGPIKI